MFELKDVLLFCGFYTGFVVFSLWTTILYRMNIKTLISSPRNQKI